MGARDHKAVAVSQSAQSDADAAFLRAIGKRVRQARGQSSTTRKVLAQRSGVSERYLALLETGQGNVSVLLLRQVAAALNLSADELLRDTASEPPGSGSIAILLRRMNAQQIARARDLLLREIHDHPHERGARIALIGLRGAGKTTLGQGLAQALKRPFIELDHEIEREAGTGLSEIFLLYGQQGYRRYERRCLEKILDSEEHCVIATGGSIVTERATYDLLLATCYTVWLTALPEEHMARVIAQGDTRPMEGSEQAMDDLRRILDSRVRLYGEADAVVDTAGKNVRQSLKNLKQTIATLNKGN